MLTALCAASIGACFPDETLRPDDASIDAPRSDLGGPDVVADTPSIDRPETPPPVDVPLVDVSDVSDASDVTDAERLRVSAARPRRRDVHLRATPRRHGLRLRRRRKLSVASLRDVLGIGAMGARSLRFAGLAGNVTALRYLTSGELVFAVTPAMAGGSLDGGVPGEGAIFTAASGDGGAPQLRVTAGRVGGIAVDGEGAVWFSDTPRNRVFRLTFRTGDAGGGVDVSPMISDVMAPTALAFDASGRVLYVASTAMGGSLYRVGLSRTVLGDLMPSDATGVLRGLGSVSGLAVDQCGNAYIADETAGRIVRASEPWTASTTLVTDVPGVRALAFGQGGTFDGDTLFFLSGGSVRAASVRARGVPLPVPTR